MVMFVAGKTLSEQQRKMVRDLFRRAKVSDYIIGLCDTDESLLLITESTADRIGECSPDSTWLQDWYEITGDHMHLTEEGWIPAEMNTREYTGEEPMEVLMEVNGSGGGDVL